jgi:hypothetical protein
MVCGPSCRAVVVLDRESIDDDIREQDPDCAGVPTEAQLRQLEQALHSRTRLRGAATENMLDEGLYRGDVFPGGVGLDVLDVFRRQKISTGKACELLGLDRMDFIRRANEHNVPVYLTTEKEWETDLAALDAGHEPQSS